MLSGKKKKKKENVVGQLATQFIKAEGHKKDANK